ncbi:MAG: molecular chaperone DnaK [Blastopirellula sp.]|nr:MAG: molecular chaperone DnaK [Blastopirellula sp.]
MAQSRTEFVAKIEEVLLVRRDALRKALDGDLSMLKELESTAGDVVDIALDSAQDELSSQLAEVESRELAQINKALERIRAGVFGACEGCECKVPIARLQVLPYASLCIKCQQELEEFGPTGVSWATEEEYSTIKSTK